MADDLYLLGRGPVLVVGLGVAGASATRALRARDVPVVLTAHREDPAALARLEAVGARWIGAVSSVPEDVGLVVVSPGVRPMDPLVLDAAARGIPVWGEVELAWQLRGATAGTAPAPWLAVTGTNGKTTTVHMLEAMLRAAGLRAAAVGNVGVSLIDAVVGADHDVLAVELSSQQLHFAPSVRPLAGALLNLAADHLDWHGSMTAYAAAKARVWNADIAIGNADDPVVVGLLAQSDAPTVRSFTLAAPRPGQLGVRDGVLVDAAGSEPLPLIEASAVRPAGAHNVANALAAAALARAYGAPPDAVAAGLRAFVPDPHRNQFVVTRGGVDYVDDSKATNPHAARGSLTAYPRVVWVAGGQLKGAPVEELVAEVAPRLAGVVLLGQDRAVIAESLQRHAPEIPVIDVPSTDDGVMTEVVRAAAGLAGAGDVVLLAPAAASYDMFSGFAARGDRFAAAARELPDVPPGGNRS